MFKSTFLFFSMISWVLLSSVSSVSSDSTEKLGNTIFKTIQDNDFNALKELIFTTDDVLQTIEEYDMPEDRKQKLIEGFVGKMESDLKTTIDQIEIGFKAIRKKIESKKCKKEIQLTKCSPNTSGIEGLPFEIGHLEIEFTCMNETETIDVEIIKTNTGWYILEKLRLKPKNPQGF